MALSVVRVTSNWARMGCYGGGGHKDASHSGGGENALHEPTSGYMDRVTATALARGIESTSPYLLGVGRIGLSNFPLYVDSNWRSAYLQHATKCQHVLLFETTDFSGFHVCLVEFIPTKVRGEAIN